MSRSLNALHPDVRPLVENFQQACKDEGIDILITCTHRTDQEQEELYAQGRTKPGKIVTNAKAGQSKHNNYLDGVPASLAVDVVPMRGGKPVWESDDPIWLRVGEIGEACGLEWAGRWLKFKEYPHFEKSL